jgi:hypothetical protein
MTYTFRLSGRFATALALAAALTGFFADGAAAQGQQARLRYAGFLEDAQVMTVQLDMAAADKASYQVSMGGDLIGMMSSMYPFHMQLTSHGRVSNGASLPSEYRSDIATSDQRSTVTLTYSAGGNIQMTDQPRSQEGQTAFARGLVRGTMDPLSAVAMIARKLEVGQSCTGRMPVFDGARRFDLTLSPLPENASPPRNLPVALKSAPRGCDAALTLISGFPQSAVDAGMYPKTARFWFTQELNSPWPVLLRIDADSGLGHLHMDFVSAD